MPVYFVEMWVPKPGEERKCLETAEKILRYVKEHREEFRERRTHRMFHVFVGGKPWFIDVQEYDDLSSMEKLDKRISRDKKYIELILEWKNCIDPRESRSLFLFDVLRELWVE